MSLPLMPKATAVWLVENTSLTFEQIADFCGMHSLEIQAIADGEVGASIMGLNPVANGQLTQEEIQRCEQDVTACLKKTQTELPMPVSRKGARYTPVAKRQDKPDAVAWLLKHHPELGDVHIRQLIGTTKKTIEAIRNKTHKNMENIKERNPVILGLCTEMELKRVVKLALDSEVRQVSVEGE